MIGNGNELRLNEATMIGVAQTWLDNQQHIKSDAMPLVKGVKWLSAENTFKIELAEKPKSEKA